MIMMTDFIHALSHFHKIWAVCDKSPKGNKSIHPRHTRRIDLPPLPKINTSK